MRDSKGFTLIELLVVMGIMLILMAVVRPMMSQSASRTREFECESNLRQISMAVHAYTEDYGAFPARLSALDSILQDRSLLVCTKTSRPYYYCAPGLETDRDNTIAACVKPGKGSHPWPHRSGDCYLYLTAGGEVLRMLR